MIRPAIHAVAGEALFIPPNPAAAIGDPDDPARRPHVFVFGGLWVRVSQVGAGNVVQPFLTIADARAAMVRGAWHERRLTRPGTARARHPSSDRGLASVRPTCAGFAMLKRMRWLNSPVAGSPLNGKSTSLCLDIGVADMPAGDWDSWTATPWSPFSYSLLLWDETFPALARTGTDRPRVHRRAPDVVRAVSRAIATISL